MIETQTQTVIPENFKMDGYLLIHRAMRQDINNMLAVATRYDSLSPESAIYRQFNEGGPCNDTTGYDSLSPELAARLQKWFHFFWDMVVVHHTEEDENFFPELTARVPSFALQMQILGDDHQELHHMVDQIGLELERLSSAAEMTGRETRSREFVALIRRFKEKFFDHLAREEACVLPAVAENFTSKEQEESGKQTMKRMPMKHMALLVPWVASTMTEEEIAKAFKELPLPLKVMYRLSWKRKYEKFTAVFRQV